MNVGLSFCIHRYTLDPTVRMSVFSVFVGGTFFKLQNTSINQATIQRFMSLPSLKHIKQTLFTFSIGLTLLYMGCIYVGLVCYAVYYDCDPMATGVSSPCRHLQSSVLQFVLCLSLQLAGRRDQLVPLLVMRVLGVVPGLPGLFVSAVFSAALSSLSTLLNSLAAVILEDFVKPRMAMIKRPMTERTVALTMRLVVVVFGISSIFMVYVVEHLGMVLQLSASLQSSLYGPMLGIFTVGMLMPWVGEKVSSHHLENREYFHLNFYTFSEHVREQHRIVWHHGLDCGQCTNRKSHGLLPSYKAASFRGELHLRL